MKKYYKNAFKITLLNIFYLCLLPIIRPNSSGVYFLCIAINIWASNDSSSTFNVKVSSLFLILTDWAMWAMSLACAKVGVNCSPPSTMGIYTSRNLSRTPSSYFSWSSSRFLLNTSTISSGSGGPI